MFRFFDNEQPLKFKERPAERVHLTVDNPSLFNVNPKRYPKISRAANVDAPMLVIFKDGHEVTRYRWGSMDQVEYVSSRVLCGPMGPNGELPV